MIDMVVPRKDMKPTLERLLSWFSRGTVSVGAQASEPSEFDGNHGDISDMPQTD